MRQLLVFAFCALLCGGATTFAGEQYSIEGRAGLADSDDWSDGTARLEAWFTNNRTKAVLFVQAPVPGADSCNAQCFLQTGKVEPPVTWHLNVSRMLSKRWGVWGEAESDDVRGDVLALGVTYRVR